MPTGYLGPLWAKTGRPLYSPGQDEARTLPGPSRSTLSVPRHIFKLILCQALTLPGGSPPTVLVDLHDKPNFSENGFRMENLLRFLVGNIIGPPSR